MNLIGAVAVLRYVHCLTFVPAPGSSHLDGKLFLVSVREHGVIGQTLGVGVVHRKNIEILSFETERRWIF